MIHFLIFVKFRKSILMTKDKFIECHERIKPFIHNTPIIKSELINKLIGSKIYFKCDNFQKMGAFKKTKSL